jgi:iron-sulfur cluster assembly accessory protein
MLQLTDRAVDKVKQLMIKESKEGYALRVAVQGGGCSGFQYALTYEREQRGDDRVLELQGLRVILDPVSSTFLEEVKIDYVESLTASGFKIENPKSTGSCGCGASFSV